MGPVSAAVKMNDFATLWTRTEILSAHGPSPNFDIRALLIDDQEACERFCQQLDVGDIRMRFASPQAAIQYVLPGLSGPGSDVAFAAIEAAGSIVGIVNLAVLESDMAEVALIVRSDRKRCGIGRALLTRAIAHSQSIGIAQLAGYVLAENRPMLELARSMGFESRRWDRFFIEVSRSIAPPRH